MWVFLWLVLGVLLGLAAADKRGFSPLGGILGGFLLGPLAFLLFFVSGGSSQLKTCPFCAEWVRPEAQVCPHCARDISARARVQARHAAEAARR